MGKFSEINRSEIGIWTVTGLSVVGAWFMKYAAVWSSGYFYSMANADVLKNQLVLLLIAIPAIVSVYFCAKSIGWVWTVFLAPISLLIGTILTIRFMRMFHASLIERVKHSNPSIEISDSICAHWIQLFYSSVLVAIILGGIALVSRLRKAKISTKTIAGIIPVAIVVLMSASTSEAAHLDDAKKFRQQGLLLQAALAATKGCTQPHQQSCAYLCALGIENQNSQWIDLGCDTACTLGDANACTTLGSRKVFSGQSSQGVTLLRRGCTLGDAIACSQLKLLKVK